MRTVASENASQESRRGRSGQRAAALRKWRLRSAAMERLEERELLATLPAPLVTQHPHNPNGGNQFAIDNIAANNGIQGNDSTPAIAIDPQNTQNMVAVWVTNNPSRPLRDGVNDTTAWVDGAYSNNGGVTWQSMSGAITGPQNLTDIGVVPPPNGPFFYSQYTDPNVAFDGQRNFYVSYMAHSSTYNSGEILLQKFNFSGTAPSQVFANRRLYRWVPTSDPAFTPTLAVDDSPPPDPTQLLDTPYGVAVSASGNVFVSSRGTDRVMQYNGSTGGFVNTYASGSTFADPQYLAFHNGNLYTANPGSQSVVLSTPSGATSTSTTLIQGDVLRTPQGAAYGPNGNLFVASRQGNSILEYDGLTGAYIRNFILPGQNGLAAPDGVVFDTRAGSPTQGALFVSSAGTSRVLVFQGPGTAAVPNPSGGQLIVGATNQINAANALNTPSALAFGTNGLYIASPGPLPATPATAPLPARTANADSVAIFNGAATSTLIQGYRLSTPRGVVFHTDPSVGPAGTQVLLVASRGSGEILEYDAVSGAFIRRFATGISSPDSLAVDAAGNVYVTTGNNQVLRYSSSGVPNATPFASGNMINPTGLTFDPNSLDLFVVSTGTNQVIRFQGPTKPSPGQFVSVYASTGLNAPTSLAFGPDRNLYVSNGNANNVLSYQGTTQASPGQFIANYTGTGAGGLINPQGITFGPDNNLYVASGNNTILRYTGPGTAQVVNPAPGPTFLSVFESAGSGGLANPYGVAFGPDGNFYASSQNTNQVLQYADVTRPQTFISNFAAVLNPTGVAVGPDGNLYVSIGSAAGTQLGMVVQYNAATGAYNGTFALPGSSLRPNGINAPKGIAFGPDGNLYVADQNGVDRYSFPAPVPGTFQRGVFAPSPGNVNPGNPNALYVSNGTGALTAGASYALVFDPQGNLDVVSATSNQVLQYTGPASPTPGLATPLNNFAAVFTPTAVAFDPTNNIVYVTNFTGNMVEAFDATTGRYIRTLIAPNSGIVQPTNLIFDTSNTSPNFGDVFVSSLGTQNVVRYSGLGVFEATLATGTQDPEGLAIDAAHNIYVSDATKNQVLRFTSSGGNNPSPGSGGAIFVRPSLGGLVSPRGLAIDAAGDLLVTSFSTNQVMRYNPNGTVDPAPGESGAVFIDAGNATFVDPATGISQTDPYFGNVYVAWAGNDFLSPGQTNGNVIRMVASSDGGQSFTTPITVSTTTQGDYGGTLRDYAPRLAISQERPAGTLSPGDPGVPGGQVSIVWDRSNFTDGLDRIMFRRISNAGTAAIITGGGTIADGGQGTPNVPVDTPFPVTVNITDPRFISVTDLNVSVSLTNPAVGELALFLLPPASTGITTPIQLMLNAVDAAGNNAFPNRGVSGANLGAAPGGGFVGLIFDDEAARSVLGQTSPTGHFRPENGSLSVFDGLTPAQLNGTWTLIVRQHRNHGAPPPPSSLSSWTLQFSSGLVPGSNPDGTPPSPPLAIATTPIRGALLMPGVAGSSFPTTTASSTVGIGPSPVIATDRTLGSFSPRQGYIYVAYVFRDRDAPGNPADNTDIFMVASPNGGLNWGAPFRVNRDNGATDGFSQGAVNDPLTGRTDGRPQYQPEIAVDQTTGTVVASYLSTEADAANARVATYVTASIDGGRTFSPASFANLAKTAVDAITGDTVDLGPIPENQSSGNGLTDGTFGFGFRQGLAVANGHVYPVWSSNRNGDYNGTALLGITTANVTIAAGPRIVSSSGLPFTMGPVTQGVASDGTPFNHIIGPDGRNRVNGFLINFDRPVDPASFTTDDVRVFYHDVNPISAANPYTLVAGGPGGLGNLTVTPIPTNDPGNPNNKFGFTQFLVSFDPQSAVGTYSYAVGPFNGGIGDIQDRVRSFGTTLAPQPTIDAPSTDTPRRVPTSGFGGTGTAADVTTSTITLSGFAGQIISGVTIDLTQLNFPAAGFANLQITLTAPNGTTTTVPSANGIFVLDGLNGGQVAGAYTLRITVVSNPNNANLFGSLNAWTLHVDSVRPTPGIQSGNVMDQNANGIAGQAPSSQAGVGAGDVFAAPTPTSRTFVFDSTQFFPGPYDQDTRPIIIAGPHVVDTSAPNVPASGDNLVQDRTNNAVDVTFDRNIRVGSFDSSQVLRVMGPAGLIGLPTTYVAPLNFPSTDRALVPINVPANIPDAGPNNSAGQLASTLTIPESYPIKNLTVSVNLTHSNAANLSIFLIGPGPNPARVQLAATGSLTGPNVNLTFADAGATSPTQPLSAFDGASIQGTWTLQILDSTVGNVGTLNSWSLHSSQAIPDPVGPTPGTLLSALTIPPTPDPIAVGNLTVTVSLTHPRLADLSLFLIGPGPNPVMVQLVPTGGIVGQNLANTTFDDTAPTTLGQNSAPYTGTFRPAQPLSAFKDLLLQGTWRLQVVDSVAGSTGTIDNWSMRVTPAATVLPAFRAPGTPVPITDNAAVPALSNLTIPASEVGAFNIKDLKVNLDITHARNSDLSIFLENAGLGVSVPLVQAGTAGGQNFVDTTFGDEGQATIGGNLGRYTGTFRPAQPLSALQNQPLAGTWTLRIVDNAPGGGTANRLNGWSLLATPTTPGTASARTFRVLVPRQELSGTYTVTLGTGITDTEGNALDSNQNAGVYVQFPQLDPNPVTTGITRQATNPVTPIPDNGALDSFLSVPDNFQIQSMTLTLNITHPNNPDLQAILLPPGATSDADGIILFDRVGATGNRANFNNTTFDDSVFPNTPISNGSPPFLGSYNPAQALSKFNGLNAGGTWTLRIRDLSGNGQTGSLNSWSLTFQKLVPHTGLGESVADQATASFRIFTTDPTNPLSSTTWTSVGPASIDEPFGVKRSGRIGGIAVDPSDPSGNTVFIGGASGGVWKTTNFLTTDPLGPTYIPLTDFGPTFGINVGSIAVFGRNNDPNQSIVFVATGEGDTGTRGVGFLRSMDGGATWTLLDSTNNNLPFASRNHLFSQNTTFSYKIVVDPTPNASGQVNVYAAISGDAAANGIWVSQDTGQTWSRVLTGNATDVLLDLASGTGAGGINPATQAPSGNLQAVYAAIRGQGVFLNTSQGFGTWNLLARIAGSPSVTPLIQDGDLANTPSLAVGNGGTTPNGPNGRIVLAKPFLTQNPVVNQIYQGWTYALVLSGNNILGLFLTKDFGQNWTDLQLPITPQFQPSNNENLPQADPLAGQGDYNVSFAIDPTNPNIVYIGGSTNDIQSGFIRVDATRATDAHAFVPFDNSRPDGGRLQVNTLGGITLKDPAIFPQTNPTNPNTSLLLEPPTALGTFQQAAYFNLIRDPQDQFATNATLFTSNVSATAGFTNSGANVRWIPFDILGTSNQHRLITTVDPLTGHARLILGSDNGVFTTVDNNGTFDRGFGQSINPVGDRNGNLQITQFFYGAVQPSNITLTNQIRAVTFYGGSSTNGEPNSTTTAPVPGPPFTDPGTLSNGDISWSGNGGGDGTGVATDQTGTGTVYRFVTPANAGTNFFQVQPNGVGPFIGRTFGLTTGSGDPQWPNNPRTYAGRQAVGNFAVNPIDGNQIVISSDAGRIFRTENQGGTWSIIGNPADLDSTYAGALAFGAPDPGASQGQGNLDNFIYAGTVSGRIFVTTTGGGSAGSNAWTNISAGLDGSGVQQIIPNPTPGSFDAFAVTLRGVYYIPNSTVAGATWQNITGNLFQNRISPFGIDSFATVQLSYISTIAVDWRYVIPNNPAVPNGPSHPMLYVGGEGGVYRSTDFGQNWTIYPNIAFDGAPADGGYLANAHVRTLHIAAGNVNPTTGRALAKVDLDNDPLTTDDIVITSPNILVATTFGRGTYSIRMAPVVFPNTNTFPQPNNFLFLDPTTDTGVSSTDGVTSDRTPIVRGLSEQSAFGNTQTINVYDGDLDPDHLNPIGTGQTDASGRFSVQITVPFATDGRHTIDVQATDQSGTEGNVASFTITLLTVPPESPGAPVLDPLGDSGIPGDDTTNNNNGPNPAPVLAVPGNAVGSVVTLRRAPLGFTSTQAAAYVTAGATLTSTLNVPASALTAAGATIPGLVLDLSTLIFSTPGGLAALSITLTAPDGTTVPVPTSNGNSIPLAGLNGLAAAGTYTLRITSPAGNELGTFGDWSLILAGVNTAAAPIAAGATVTSQVTIPDADLPAVVVPAGATRTATLSVPITSLSGPAASVASLSLDLSQLAAAPAGSLTVTLQGPDGTVVPIAGPFTAGMNVAAFVGKQAAGNYVLSVTNAGGAPVTLSRWSMSLTDGGAVTAVFPYPAIQNGVVLDLSQLAFATPADLTITLEGPDGTVIPVPAPYGRFVSLAGLNARLAAGTYTLRIVNAGGTAGTLGSWSLGLPGTITAVTSVNSVPGATTGAPPVTVKVPDTNNGAGAIPNGIYLYTAFQTDQAGNSGLVGPGVVITIDTTGPRALPPLLTSVTDSGLPVPPRDADDITNLPRPSFEGIVEPNATVQLFVNGVAAGTSQADAAGFYIVDATAALTEGLNNITIVASDVANNAGAASQALVVRLDTTPPPGLTPVLAPSSDTGLPLAPGTATDNVTADNTPTFVGTAEVSPYLGANPTALTDGALVQLYAQVASAPGAPANPVVLVGEALADPVTGAFSVTVGQYVNPQSGTPVLSLGDETYNISLIQFDVAGNPSRVPLFGNTGAVVIDGTDSPLHGDNFGPGGRNQLGWLYMEKVLELIQPNVTTSARTLVGLGVNPTLFNGNGLVTETIESVFAQSQLAADGWNLVLVTGAANIDAYLSGGVATALTTNNTPAGTITLNQTGLLYITTGNKLGDDLTNQELGIVNQHGQDIKNFLNRGGGLYAQTETPTPGSGVTPFGWLTSLFPGIQPVLSGGTDLGIALTPEAATIFPTASVADFQNTIWHNYFTGTFDPLAVVATVTDFASGNAVPLVLASAGGVAGNSSLVTIDTTIPQPQPTAAPLLQAGSDSGVAGDNITNFNNSGSAHPAPVFNVANVEAGAQVQLFRNGVLVNTLINTAAGTVAIADINQGDPAQSVAVPPVAGPPIPDGTYTYTVVVTDRAGNVAPAGAGTSVTILATAPTTPFNLGLLTGSDSGTFDNDAVTNFNNTVTSPSNAPVFRVSGIGAGNLVRLLRNGLVVSTLVSASGGTVDIADTNNGNGRIFDGTYTYRVQQVDVASNVSTVSVGLTVRVDSTSPASPAAVTLDPSTDSGTFNNDGITFFNNSAGNAPLFNVTGVEANATLRLFRNGVLVNTLTNTAGGTVQIADVNGGNGTIPDGTYVYTVQQVDLAGNVGPVIGTGASVVIQADLSANSPVQLDPNSDTGVSNSDGITQVTLFRFPVFNVAGIVPGATLHLFRNNVIVATLTNTAGGTVQITDSSTLLDGTYTYAARQTDLAGNVGPISSPIQVTYDTTAPAAPSAPVLSPVASNQSSISNPSFNVFNVEPNATVRLLRDGVVVATLVGVTPSGPGSAITITDPGPVSNGVHTFTAFQVDRAGNTSPIGPGVVITFGPEAPTGFTLDPSTDSGVQGDNITNNVRPAFAVAGVAPGATVRLIRNGNVVASLTSAGGGTVVIAEPGPLAPGAYSYTVQQVDATGTASPPSAPLGLTVVTSVAAPGLSLDPASDTGNKGDGITSVRAPTFALANVSAGATVTLLRNGGVVATLTNAPGGALTITDPGPLADGSYNYTVQQVDVAGNTSPVSITLTLTVNTVVPAPPTVALDPASDTGTPGDGITSNPRPTILIGGILPGATVRLSRTGPGGTAVVRTIVNASAATATFTEPSPLISGQYTYTVQQTSAAGTASADANVTVTVDTTAPPPAPVVSLDPASDTGAQGDGSTTATTNLVLVLGNILPGATVTVFRNNVAIGTVSGPAGGLATFTDPGPLAPGVYSYTAQQASIGGPSPRSAVFSLTIVSTGPAPQPRVAGDYNADGRTDFALFHRNPTTGQGVWYIANILPNSGVPFGSSTKDIPVQLDFNGDRRVDIAVYRPSTAQWFIGGQPTFTYGQPGVDIPVPGYYDGLAATQVATYRPTTGQWFIGGHAQPLTLGGRPGDIPVPADYDGDGRTDIAIFRPGTRQWFIGANAPVTFGGSGDIPVPGDYDGLGHAQIATFRPATRQWFVAGSPTLNNVTFGGRGDVPVPGDYDGTGRTQIATFRPGTGQWFIAGHPAPLQFGGRRMVPAIAPQAYRAITGNLSIKSTGANFAASAAALSANSTATRATASTTSGQGTTSRTTVSVFSSAPRNRPNQAAPKQAAPSARQFLSQQRLRLRSSAIQAKLPGGPLSTLWSGPRG